MEPGKSICSNAEKVDPPMGFLPHESEKRLRNQHRTYHFSAQKRAKRSNVSPYDKINVGLQCFSHFLIGKTGQ